MWSTFGSVEWEEGLSSSASVYQFKYLETVILSRQLQLLMVIHSRRALHWSYDFDHDKVFLTGSQFGSLAAAIYAWCVVNWGSRCLTSATCSPMSTALHACIGIRYILEWALDKVCDCLTITYIKHACQCKFQVSILLIIAHLTVLEENQYLHFHA